MSGALTVLISAHGICEPLAFDGETIVVDRHGALIFCTAPLRAGLEIAICVIITDKRAKAKVVYVDPKRPQVGGIELEKPENIWEYRSRRMIDMRLPNLELTLRLFYRAADSPNAYLP